MICFLFESVTSYEMGLLWQSEGFLLNQNKALHWLVSNTSAESILCCLLQYLSSTQVFNGSAGLELCFWRAQQCPSGKGHLYGHHSKSIGHHGECCGCSWFGCCGLFLDLGQLLLGGPAIHARTPLDVPFFLSFLQWKTEKHCANICFKITFSTGEG